MKKRGMKILISLILYILALVLPFSNKIVNNVIFLASYIIVGFEIIKKAVRNIFRGKVFDENFLMTVATVGAIATGEFPEAVAVMLFYQVGELFQSYAIDKSRKSIASLMDIRPDYANVKRNEKIATFVEIVAFDKKAIILAHNVGKGSRLAVEGRISTSNYITESGEKRYKVDVILNEFTFIDSKKKVVNEVINQEVAF